MGSRGDGGGGCVKCELVKRDTNEVTDEVNVRELRRNVSRDTLTFYEFTMI